MKKPSDIVDSYEYPVKLVRVIDGDTIVVIADLGFDDRSKKILRFAKVDTYEMRDSDPEKKKLAQDASALVLRLITEYAHDYGNWFKVVSKEYDGKGKYGRWIGEIVLPYSRDDSSLADVSINVELEDAGFVENYIE